MKEKIKGNFERVGDLKKFPRPDDYLNFLRQRNLNDQVEVYKKLILISEKIKEAGGRSLLVGGSVRDLFFGKISKDFDLEVYGIEPADLEVLVGSIAKISDVGKAFGILKVDAGKGLDIDLSLPRTDSKVSEGHRGFEVMVDPNMSFEDAAKRRDFTMNSLSADPLTGEIFDYFNGLEDIRNRRLKITDPERFKDDPLRVMRALQFISRFGLSLDSVDADLMKGMTASLKELPKERLLEEWKKLLIKGDKPSLGLMAGMQLGVFKELHPQFPPLTETRQDEKWHPEGDVWMHTLMTIDEAAKVCRNSDLSEKDYFTIMLSALCHDIGKPKTFKDIDGKITSYGHDKAGIGPSEDFLSSISVEKDIKEKVLKLVGNHMAPSLLYASEKRGDKVTDGAIIKLSKRVHPATIEELLKLAEADYLGRGPFTQEGSGLDNFNSRSYEPGDWLRERAFKLKIFNKRAESLVRGRDLIDRGVKKPEKGDEGFNFGKAIELGDRLRDLSEELKKELVDEEGEFSKDDYFQIIENIENVKDMVDRLKESGIEMVQKIRSSRNNNKR